MYFNIRNEIKDKDREIILCVLVRLRVKIVIEIWSFV